MKKVNLCLQLLLFVIAIKQVDALELRFYPVDQLYLNMANARFNTYDVVAHFLIVKNDGKETIALNGLRYQLYSNKNLIQELHISPESMVKATTEILGLRQAGLPMMADALCPPEALGKEGKLSSKNELQHNEALTSRNVYVTTQTVPTRMRVEATGTNTAGKPVSGSTEISILQYKSPNNYIFPLEGEWFMQAVPNVTSHHRWMFQTEFGIDFLKVDDKGSLFKTHGKDASDYYGYGQPVLAAADGVVVMAINDVTQNWDAWMPREGESEEEFEKRAAQYQVEALKKDLTRAVTGNLVVIEHSNKEFSAYAHLKTGSVRIKVGDQVKQGQKIAEVGDTGDYYRPHLHFQISNYPDVVRSRSLPFEFTNLVTNKPELGHFARIKTAK